MTWVMRVTAVTCSATRLFATSSIRGCSYGQRPSYTGELRKRWKLPGRKDSTLIQRSWHITTRKRAISKRRPRITWLQPSERILCAHRVRPRTHRRAANQLMNMTSLASLYAANGRPSLAVRIAGALLQSLMAILLVLPAFLLFATRRPEPNKFTLGLPFEIIDFNASSIMLAVVLGGLPLLLAGVFFAHLAVPQLMKRVVSAWTMVVMVLGGWALALTSVLLGYGALVGLLRLDALDDLSSKYVGGATLQLLLGNYSLVWTAVVGTLFISFCWTILLRLQARGWARQRASRSPTTMARARRWSTARQASLLLAAVGGLTSVLLIVYQLGILPNGSAQSGMSSATFAGLLLPAAGLAVAGVAGGGYTTRRIQSESHVQLGFFGFEAPLLLALAFGLVSWFGMRQAVIISANGVDTPGSLTPFNRAVAMFPDLATAYYLRGERHLANGDFAGARDDFDTAAELDPSFPATYLARGRVLMELGETQAALEDAERLIGLRPDHPGGYAIRALAKAQSGDLSGAAEDLEFATRPLPESAQAWDAFFVRCLALAAVARLDEAEQDCERVQELNPGHIISLDQLGLIAFARANEERDRETAIAHFHQGIDAMTGVLEVQPDNVAAWTNRGEAYGLVGQYARDTAALEQSEEDLTRALELDPTSLRALLARALTRLYLDRLDDAAGDMATAEGLYGANAAAAEEQGVPGQNVYSTALFIALHSQDYENVIRQGEALEATGFATMWVLSNRGLAKIERGELEAGLADIDQALGVQPDAALAFDRRGYAYFRMGDQLGQRQT